MFRGLQAAVVTTACILQLGCAVIKDSPAINKPGLTPYSDITGKQRYTTLEFLTASPKPMHVAQSKPVFIGVAISGGGTRAANFGLASLMELEAMGVLEHVSVISSVSGGSVAAAYFGLKGAPPAPLLLEKEGDAFKQQRSHFWEETRRKFAANIRTSIIAKALNPANLLATLYTPKTRTDLLAEVLDENFFNQETFSQLGDFGPFRPYLRLNATVAERMPPELEANPGILADPISAQAGRGQPFSFVSRSFQRLKSSLANLKLSDAVAASSAFPGAFANVSLAAYETANADAKPLGYVKLLDGGPADNLGVEALGDSFTHWAGQHDSSACLVIVVDAFARETEPLDSFRRRDSRNWLDRLIDTNFVSALDALLLKRRVATLQGMGIAMSGGTQIVDPILGEKRMVRASQRFEENGTLPSGYGHRCAIWHLNLENASAIVNRTPHAFDWSPTEEDRWNGTAVSWLASSVGTDYNLTGPAHCTTDILQNAIWDAAKVVVHDDQKTREAVCEWMANAGINVGKTCATKPSRNYQRKRYGVVGATANGIQAISCLP